MKRYIHTLRDGFVEMPFSGPWVRYEDAAELQQQLDAIRAIVESDEWRRVNMTSYDRQMERIEDVIREGEV